MSHSVNALNPAINIVVVAIRSKVVLNKYHKWRNG